MRQFRKYVVKWYTTVMRSTNLKYFIAIIKKKRMNTLKTNLNQSELRNHCSYWTSSPGASHRTQSYQSRWSCLRLHSAQPDSDECSHSERILWNDYQKNQVTLTNSKFVLLLANNCGSYCDFQEYTDFPCIRIHFILL